MELKKHDLVISILEKMQPYWKDATDFLLLLETKYVDEGFLDALIGYLSAAIKCAKTKQNTMVLQRGLDQLKKIKEIEQAQSEDGDSIDYEFEDILENLYTNG